MCESDSRKRGEVKSRAHLHQPSSSGLTGRSSTPRRFVFNRNGAAILDPRLRGDDAVNRRGALFHLSPRAAVMFTLLAGQLRG
jgi:hypothetical protein